jgi:PAS domain-containing protein
VSLAVQDVNAVDILDTVHQPLLLLSADLYVVTANPAFYAMFRLSPLETQHQLVYELGDGEWREPRLRELVEGTLLAGALKDVEVRQTFRGIGLKTILLNSRGLKQSQPHLRSGRSRVDARRSRRRRSCGNPPSMSRSSPDLVSPGFSTIERSPPTRFLNVLRKSVPRA